MPLSSICHIRDSTRIDSFAANSRARDALGLAERDIVGGGGDDLHPGDEIDEFGEVGQHHDRIGADVILRAEFAERAGDIAARQMLEQIDHPGAVGQPQHLPHGVGLDQARGMRDRLIEQRQRIAHRAFGGARDDAERLGLDLDAFLCRDVAEMLHQHVGLDPAQIETLAARQHRDRDLADFGGGEHEFGVLRRLLQRLQEGVERRRRQHVDFVDDVDLVAGAGRRVAHAVIDLADVVDAGMGRGVHLEDVHVPAFHDRLAVHAEVRHVDGRPLHRTISLLVVQRAGENARGGGFADAADAGEDPGLRNPTGFERIRDGADHGLLADQIVEAGRAVFACQHPVGLGGLAAAGQAALAVSRFVGGSASITHRSIRN